MMREGGRVELLTFGLAGDEYAVALGGVLEIVACGPITRVPAMPPFVRGAVNLRGRPVPVIDLALKFGFAATELTRFTCLVIVRVDIAGEPTTLGALVDDARRLVEVEPVDLSPPPPVGTRVHPEYLVGLARAGDALVPVLDLARVLSTEELLLVAEADRAARPPDGSP